MSEKIVYTEKRTAKDPAAHVAEFAGSEWGGKMVSALLVSVEPGQTKSGRKRFVIEFTLTPKGAGG